MRKAVLIAALAVLLAPVGAMADTIIDFGINAPTAGTISYDGLGGALVGTGISVDNVTGINTPLNNYVTVALPSVLNFTTGPLTGTTATTWSFGGGGGSTITIGDGVNTWLSGTFGNATVTAFQDIYGNFTNFKIAGAAFTDVKNPDLLAFYGLSAYTGLWLPGNFNISFNAPGGAAPPSGFTSTNVLSGDVTNTVPEPGTLTLFGTGLFGIAGFLRRRLNS